MTEEAVVPGSAAVLGLGYVGLPLAVEMAQAGWRVLGVDIDPERVAALQSGHSYIGDVPAQQVEELAAAGRLRATTDFSGLAGVEVIVICVPTPLRKTREPDLTHVLAATTQVANFLRPGQLVILESTTYPGATERVVRPELEKGGLRAGRDFALAFSPERVDPGNRRFGIRNTPKVVGGVTPDCTRRAVAFYRTFVEEVVPVSSATVAEAVKLLENSFRAVNIALVNELAMLCDRLGLDVWEVVEAAATKPFGFLPFQPGPGVGGHCIPVDPDYLIWRARAVDFHAHFIELAQEINGNMPRFVVHKVGELLNLYRLPLHGARLLLLGVSYKRDVADVRESPALEIIQLLWQQRAEVEYCDPLVPVLQVGGKTLTSQELTAERLSRYDCAVLLTDHSCFDYPWLARSLRLIFDTRNAFRACPAPHIYRLGSPLTPPPVEGRRAGDGWRPAASRGGER